MKDNATAETTETPTDSTRPTEPPLQKKLQKLQVESGDLAQAKELTSIVVGGLLLAIFAMKDVAIDPNAVPLLQSMVTILITYGLGMEGYRAVKRRS